MIHIFIFLASGRREGGGSRGGWGVKSFRTGWEIKIKVLVVKMFRTRKVLVFQGVIFVGKVSTPLHAMNCYVILQIMSTIASRPFTLNCIERASRNETKMKICFEICEHLT